MTTTDGTIANPPTKNPKKANLLDHHSIKYLLDESVSEVQHNFISAHLEFKIL